MTQVSALQEDTVLGNVKLSLCLTKPWSVRGRGYIDRLCLDLSTDGGGWSDSRPFRFTLGERAPCTHWIGGCVGPRAGLNDVEKRKLLTLQDSNSDQSVVQPLASRCTDCTISPPVLPYGPVTNRMRYILTANSSWNLVPTALHCKTSQFHNQQCHSNKFGCEVLHCRRNYGTLIEFK
jgi:hypothetical protein